MVLQLIFNISSVYFFINISINIKAVSFNQFLVETM